MAKQGSTFSKLQRDRDKQAKAAAKRDRRQNRGLAAGHETTEGSPLHGADGDPRTQEVLSLIEVAHQQYADGIIDFDTFEKRKAQLLGLLPSE